MATRERPSKLRWLAVLTAVAVLGCDPAAETDAGSGFDAEGVVDAGEPDVGPPDSTWWPTFTPALHDFGFVAVDDASSSATFTLTNDSLGVTNTISATFGGGDAREFRMGADTCTGARLAPAETCTIAVTYQPSERGSASATLNATDGRATAIATLEGRGVIDGRIFISPTPRDFGATTVGTETPPTTFTVENGSPDIPSGALTIMVGGADASQFTLGVDNCTGMALAGGASCTVEGIYSPTAAAAHAATFEATAAPGGSVSAAVTGTAITPAALQLLPGVQDFGGVASGTSSASVDFTLRNTGGVPTGIIAHSFGGPNAPEFMVTSSFCIGVSLAPAESCVVSLRFNAGSPGAKTATLDFTDGSLTATAALSGIGI